MDIKAALSAFDALSQETRLDVFRLLIKAGPDGLAAGEIADELGILQNTLSSHLKTLSASALIASRRHGRSIFYSVRFATVRELTLFLLEDCCGGNAAVCAPVAESLAAGCK